MGLISDGGRNIIEFVVIKVYFFAGANNLIPMEIALKITNKIKANERFSAYIIIPMWPEGVPTSTTTQRILYWQVHHCSLFLLSCLLVKKAILMLETLWHYLWVYCNIFPTWFRS
jgi:hypothetical protein